ncbi:MAG: metal-dependent hydrolase [Elusimicrobia bacterium]|nr:metal-dependent hydrolase [Elusimicrobiota bacterium]
MDPLAHGLLGALIGRTAGLRHKNSLWLCAAIAEAPDLDVLALGLKEPPEFLTHRATATHSLPMVILAAWPLSLILKRWGKDQNLSGWSSYAISLAGLISHVAADCMTTYGTPAWAPFSSKNIALDWIGNLNWPAWLLIGAGLWLTTKQRAQYRAAYGTWAALVLFVLGSMGLRERARKLIETQQPELSWSIFPHIFIPWWYRGIGENAHAYATALIAPLSGRMEPMGSYPKALGSDIEASRRAPSVRLFLRHNRWPVAFLEESPNNIRRVIWGNPLFSPDGKNIFGRAVVELDQTGNILRHWRDGKAWP